MHVHVEMLRGKQDVVTDIELKISAMLVCIVLLPVLCFLEGVFGT